MLDLRLAHTADLSPRDLSAVRALLDDAFVGPDACTAEDHEHALGGLHALLWEGSELVGHGSVVMRRLLHGGQALRTGYVEAVAVRTDRRRRRHGDAVMGALERVVRGGYALGALSATSDAAAFYTARGWQVWAGTTSVLTPDGRQRTPDDDGGVLVLPVTARLALAGDLACGWRNGDV